MLLYIFYIISKQKIHIVNQLLAYSRCMLIEADLLQKVDIQFVDKIQKHNS